MKLIRFGEVGQERPGLLGPDDQIYDVSSYVEDYVPEIIGQTNFFSQLQAIDLTQCPQIPDGVRIAAPISRPGKIICVGFNAKAHAQELGITVSKNQQDVMFFLKASSSLCGPYDDIEYGKKLKKLDWEAELAFVIGRRGKYIPRDEALDYILGYCCMNDLSDRYLQFEIGETQYTKAKSFDGSAPLGPYVVTAESLSGGEKPFDIKLWVNGELRQDFNTSHYLHHEAEIIHYISQYLTLYPGDVISMGSAPGNAATLGADYFLKPGDEMELEISGLGKQHQHIVNRP